VFDSAGEQRSKSPRGCFCSLEKSASSELSLTLLVSAISFVSDRIDAAAAAAAVSQIVYATAPDQFPSVPSVVVASSDAGASLD
jgi:hypothetical protein